MKKPVLIIVAILLIAGVVGGIYLWQHVQKDPAIVAEAFLKKIEEQDYGDLEAYLGGDQDVNSAQIGQAFRRFSQAFGLTGVAMTDLVALSKDNKTATYKVALSYESRFFAPLVVETNLNLRRGSVLEDWRILWEDNLPLPAYGLEADYARVRQEPSRGQILDSTGQILAGAGSRVSVGVQPDRITDPDTLLQALQIQLGLSPEYVRRQYEAPGVQAHWFVPLTTISEAEYQQADPALRPIPGVFFRRVDARSYPEGATMSHLTGYLGEVTATMLEAYPEREYVSGELVGRAGLEQSQDDSLRGRPGYRFFVILDEERTLLTEKEVQDGEDVAVTLDGRMQELAIDVLGDRKGALVVLDAQTGAILALVSTPGYDANEFVGGISSSRWQELSTDERLPMFNRALQGLYPPGSVFKVVTVAAAVDQGLYEAGSIFVDSGELAVQGNIVRNYQREVFGEHNLHQAVVNSINTTVARIGLDLGAARLDEYFRGMALDQSYYLGLPMMSGRLGTPERSRVALAWSSIGQDQVLLTPLHMAQIFSIFANNGTVPPIHLLRDEEEKEGHLALKPETVTQLNGMLQDVVLQGTGIALRNAGLSVYGKTGTAEVGSEVHAWFAGHTELPGGKKLAFSVLVEEGGLGGQAAAPLMSEYLTRLIQ